MLALFTALQIAAARGPVVLPDDLAQEWRVEGESVACPARSPGPDIDVGIVHRCTPDPGYTGCIVVAVPIRARPEAAMEVIQDIEGNGRFFTRFRFDLDGPAPIATGREYLAGGHRARRLSRYRYTAVASDRMAAELVEGGGPFARFKYDHRVRPLEAGSLSTEQVQYRIAGGPFGRLLELFGVRRTIARVDCEAHLALDALMSGMDLSAPTGPGSLAPSIVVDGEALRLIWWEPDGEGHRLMTVRGDGRTWEAPVPIATGGAYFANWADTPMLGRGPGEMWLATWPEMVGETPYAYGVAAAVSADGGGSWRSIGLLHDDQTATEHGFVSLLPDADGVRAFWLDGRETVDGGAMTLRTARVAPDGGVSAAARLDARVCDCCGTSAAVVETDPLIVYRDRTESEVRDTSVVHLSGDTGAPPQPVSQPGWQLPGCPVNGPRVAVNGSHVAVAEFTAAQGQDVLLVQSADAGRSWLPPVQIAGDGALGRVDIAALDDGFVVGWLAPVSDDDAVYRARRVSVDGRAGPPVTLLHTTASRPSGFPRLAVTSGQIVIAWTEVADLTQVRVHRFDATLLSPPAEVLKPPTTDTEEQRRLTWPGDLTVPTLDDGTLAFADRTGRPALVHLWATWCAPCRDELPVWVRHQRAWSDLGIALIGLAVDDEADRVRSVMDEVGATWPVGLIPSSSAAARFGPDAVPRTLLFDAAGQLVWSHTGPLEGDASALQAAIDGL